MEEIKIIDENHINYNGSILKAVNDSLWCDGCVFLVQRECKLYKLLAKKETLKKISCSHSGRKDGRNVIWVIEDYTPEPYDEAIARAKEEIEKCLPEKKLPKTWEEYCEIEEDKKLYYITTYSDICECAKCNTNEIDFNKNLLPSQELAEAMLALCQLLQLREYYNDGWKPDYTDDKTYKYCICIVRGKIETDVRFVMGSVLVFKTYELRDEFLKNFRDLIEIAKPLL